MESRNYAPDVFLRENIDEAKKIILLPEAGLTTDERWERETGWLVNHLRFPAGLVIDFGCGVGRLAREMTDRPVLGVDISSTMRSQAEQYVHRTDFGAVSPIMLAALVDHGLQAAGAIAAWVLQHSLDPGWDIDLLSRAIKPGGRFVVLNRFERVIPTINEAGHFAWCSDNRDIDQIIRTRFALEEWINPPDDVCDPGAFLAIYRRY